MRRVRTKKEQMAEKITPASLPIPFKLGIAFVPEVASTTVSTTGGAVRRTIILSEKQKSDLTNKIIATIHSYPFY